MAFDTPPASGHRDLQDLSGLARSPLHSLIRKAAEPTAPRPKTPDIEPARYPALAAFAPSRIWQWLTEYLKYRFGPRHAFQDYSGQQHDTGIHALRGDGGEIRIAIAGDWSTGTDEAAAVAARIGEFAAHYTLHLGDVYYVGDASEVGEKFLGEDNPRNAFKPTRWPMGSEGGFSLNGNHEMYARGKAYFERMLPALGPIVDGKAQGQTASFFCLENEFWRVIAVDTGYNSIGLPLLEYITPPDCALPAPLLEWLRDTVKPRADDPRGIILLSHHQYFSRFDNFYVKPATQLAEFFPRPVLWFWGHEHRMAIYPEYAVPGGLRAHGRCVGHGGMPVDLPPEPPPHPECPVTFVDARPYRNNENLKVGYNGFARLTLKGNSLHVAYVDLQGTIVYEEDWRADAGLLKQLNAGPRIPV